MLPEKEPTETFLVSEMMPDDTRAVTMMRRESWLDTYINDDLGITREWIENRFNERLTYEADQAFKESLINRRENETFLVAKDADDHIIGAATAYIGQDGTQHFGSLYTQKQWHGKGVGDLLMKQVFDRFDKSKPIELGVAIFNDRAKAFYRKWGFKEIPGSERLFADKIPEIIMIRKGDIE